MHRPFLKKLSIQKPKQFALSCLLLPFYLHAKDVVIQSPNGEISVTISDENHPHYQVNFNNTPVLADSKLGFRFKNAPSMEQGFTISKVEQRSHNSQWKQPWGEQQVITDRHNEITVTFSHKRDTANTFSVVYRVFDDGLGFRYQVPKQKGLNTVNIIDELTEFSVVEPKNNTAWWIPARGWNRYEYIYETSNVESVDRVHTPFTYRTNDNIHVSIHEAALVDYAAMTLNQQRPGVLKADLTPWSDGILVKTKTSFKTPWRTVQISNSAIGLLNSHLILNLNDDNILGDVSWVKPGKYVGIWWGMHINENTWGSGEKHGATTAETKRYMNFAAKHGFDGVLVEGWNIGWDGDWFHNGDVFKFDQAYDDFDINAVSQHGENKGVSLIGHHETSGNVTNYRNQMEDAFKLYKKHGVSQVKTGYVADGGNIKRIDENGIVRKEWHDGQFMVNEYLYNIKLAAKYGISINTHEPIKDTGLRRTYPNWITREGARGQEFNAWGTPPNPPEHAAILPYTRMLAGPMDFTPGIFDMGFNGLDENANRPQTTLAKQLALYVVLYSPIQMAADLPRNYEANLPAFQFIKDVTTDWSESRAIAGEVGDYVVFARKARDSQEWFVGGLTDEKSRDLSLKFDFLDSNAQYQAEIYKDGDNADWLTAPYELTIEKIEINSKSTLPLTMASSGGFAIRLVPKK